MFAKGEHMGKTRYMVFSGFLGAGKTTTMIAIGEHLLANGGSPAILANDLGGKNLVDGEFSRTTNIPCKDITGDCICYIHNDLIDKLHQFEAEGANFIMSDIPGCGIGAYDHVYSTTNQNEPDEFDLMPFTCIVDPERLRMLLPEKADINLPEEMSNLLHAQMKEADLIVLNKIDTISEETRQADVDFITTSYPRAKVMCISAATGEGVPELVDYLLSAKTKMELVDIGYGQEDFINYEKIQCWYNNRSYFAQRDEQELCFNEVFTDLFEEIRAGVKAAGGNVPHLKLFAAGIDGDVAKMSLIGVDYDINYDRKLEKKYAAIGFVVNARAIMDSQEMTAVVADAIDAVCQKHNLKCSQFFLECFGMMDEGKGNGGRASRLS